ncbi:hypothetical protein J6590_010385 [Homalodisca vitripennis]|nr:hypothetical protein J6590_010385 [Homalodisca vitripennis]
MVFLERRRLEGRNSHDGFTIQEKEEEKIQKSRFLQSSGIVIRVKHRTRSLVERVSIAVHRLATEAIVSLPVTGNIYLFQMEVAWIYDFRSKFQTEKFQPLATPSHLQTRSLRLMTMILSSRKFRALEIS